MNISISKIIISLKKLQFRQYIGLFGLVLILSGWALANAYRWPIVYRVVAPQYAGAMSALDKMNEKGFVLMPGDRGFEEIGSLVKGYFEETVNREIGQIRTLSKGVEILETGAGNNWQPFLELEVVFPAESSFQGKFYDLESKVEAVYLKSRLLTWRDAIFGVGVILVGVGLFI